MAHVVVRHKIGDYSKWRAAFDSVVDFRKEGGEQSFRIFRNADDENELVGVFEWESMNKAKEFFAKPEIKQKMKESGLTDEPTIFFLNEA